jgi:hypothetical protein
MITALTALLVLISLGLVVPVALATPGEWRKFKSNFVHFSSLQVLFLLLLLLTVFHLQFNNLEIIV